MASVRVPISARPRIGANFPPAVPELPAELVRGAEVLPSRPATVQLMPKGKVFVEVGVALGHFTRHAFDVTEPSEFIAIDTFKLHELTEFWGKPSAAHFDGLTHRAWFSRRFAPEIAAGRMRVLEGDSVVMLQRLPDQSIDIVYVDADHSYEAVAAELDVLERKMKTDGYIILDDYILVEYLKADAHQGVIYAAHEFMIEHGWALHYFTLQTNTYYHVVLRKAHLPRPAEQRVIDVRARLDRAEAELMALRTSRSWRVTAPVRWLSGGFRKIVG